MLPFTRLALHAPPLRRASGQMKCHGQCCTLDGKCPTSSCVANNLGRKNLNCVFKDGTTKGSANCGWQGGAGRELVARAPYWRAPGTCTTWMDC